ncbi:hypothetical protein QTL97_03915 [Sporosarcina thermotolerans]|uniref:Uncharacterized protein n=1 Tax=Sporosarcina thermotolerans TaxID=633404 RepID=A0AAW9A5C2_9BACL|nr:hypothetical protein [Sporosarcina thermotolerans]MDW0116069.1 hypothetical protein [Sporosarcina thermotolerans]WHT48040.1 hypothetical protein QNH10_18670 [Sporosarcina thermotolerans]
MKKVLSILLLAIVLGLSIQSNASATPAGNTSSGDTMPKVFSTFNIQN